MNAANSLETKLKPMPDHRLPEPSMEEILASIRRIIADDESLPGRKDAIAPAPEAETVGSSDPEAEATDAHGYRVDLADSAEPMLSVGELVSEDVLHSDGPALDEDVAIGHSAMPADEFGSPQTTLESANLAHPTPWSPRPAPLAPPEPVAAPAMDHGLRRSFAAADEQTTARMDVPIKRAATLRDEVSAIADIPSQETSSAQQEVPIRGEVPIPGEAHGLPSDALFSEATHQSVAAAFRTLAATRFADNSEELLDIARDMIRPLLKNWIDSNVPAMVERMVRAEIERVARGGR